MSIRGSDPIPDIGEVFPEKIETRTSYFTGYRIGDVYRDHAHNCKGDGEKWAN